jgi:hypothetical protein
MNQTSLFSAIYAFGGLFLIPVISEIAGSSEYGNLTGIYLLVHFLSAILLWPTGVAASWLLLRLLRPRSWRGQTWRACTAGLLAVPLNWGGLTLSSHLIGRPPEFLRALAGEGGAAVLLLLSLAILFTNLSIALGWALPPWTWSRVQRRRPESSFPPSRASKAE